MGVHMAYTRKQMDEEAAAYDQAHKELDDHEKVASGPIPGNRGLVPSTWQGATNAVLSGSEEPPRKKSDQEMDDEMNARKPLMKKLQKLFGDKDAEDFDARQRLNRLKSSGGQR